MTRAIFALLLIATQFPAVAATRRAVGHPSAPVPPPAIVKAAHEAAEAAMKEGVPAVQIAVSDHGQIIYSEAFGMTDKENAIAATPRSVLQIGSVTKQFTAAAILRLAERGALTLDDRIEKYVPEFDPRGQTITLRMLLRHTSGLRRDWMPNPGAFNFSLPVTRAEVLKGLNSGNPFDFSPNVVFSYSNAAYMLLGYAVESITGMSFADFIHNEFVLPLGLIDTGVCGTHNLPLPEGYGVAQTQTSKVTFRMEPFHPTVALGGGSICSTASDLARWSHLLAAGIVMLPSSYAAMITTNKLAPYGFGVGVQKQLGYPTVWHDGAIYGFQSILIYFSDQDLAVAVNTNAFAATGNGSPQTIALAVAKAALSAPVNNAAIPGIDAAAFSTNRSTASNH